MDTIVNKVAESGIVTINLEHFLPTQETAVIDLKDYLFMGMILKEKDFRAALLAKDWAEYSGKNVAVVCTADAIIPMWAYMLLAMYLEPVVNFVYYGTEIELQQAVLQRNLKAIDVQEFADKRVVIKGCGDKSIPELAYLEITRLLLPVVKSLMYGEPCSTVPIYKQKKPTTT